MLVLDEGAWASFPCDQRTGVMIIIILAAMVAVFALVLLNVQSERQRVEVLGDPPLISLRSGIAVGIAALAGSLTLLFYWASPVETLIGLEGNSIVETMCLGPFADEYRLDKSKTDIRYITEISIEPPHGRHRPSNSANWYGYVRREVNYLELTEPGKDTLRIFLDGNRNLANLKALAPKALQSYKDYRHDRVVNGFPKPATVPEAEPPHQKIVRTF